jgi:tetratricopeptide (TPR) repeat protein
LTRSDALLGTLYLDVKEYVPARKTIENGLLLNPGSCVLWLLKAFSFVFQENYIQAFNSCKHVLKEDSNNWMALYFIGLLYSIQKEYDNALLYFKRAAKLTLDRKEILLSITDTLSSMDKIDEAIIMCNNLVKNHHNFLPAWEKISSLYILKKDWQKVVNTCTKAMSICGDSASLWSHMGGAYDNLKQYRLSIDCYDKALKRSPESSITWYNKGSVLLKLSVVDKDNLIVKKRSIEEAMKCGERAIAADDKFSKGWYIYALAHLQDGKMDKGRRLLGKAANLGSMEAKFLNQIMNPQKNI